MATTPSLFDPPANAVLPAASEWVTGTLFGSLSVSLCVLAVAFVGLMLMTGRVAIRDGLRVMIGCFVLLGAPLIASGLLGVADGTARRGPSQKLTIEAAPTELPPASPYAGASMRRD